MRMPASSRTLWIRVCLDLGTAANVGSAGCDRSISTCPWMSALGRPGWCSKIHRENMLRPTYWRRRALSNGCCISLERAQCAVGRHRPKRSLPRVAVRHGICRGVPAFAFSPLVRSAILSGSAMTGSRFDAVGGISVANGKTLAFTRDPDVLSKINASACISDRGFDFERGGADGREK